MRLSVAKLWLRRLTACLRICKPEGVVPWVRRREEKASPLAGKRDNCVLVTTEQNRPHSQKETCATPKDVQSDEETAAAHLFSTRSLRVSLLCCLILRTCAYSAPAIELGRVVGVEPFNLPL